LRCKPARIVTLQCKRARILRRSSPERLLVYSQTDWVHTYERSSSPERLLVYSQTDWVHTSERSSSPERLLVYSQTDWVHTYERSARTHAETKGDIYDEIRRNYDRDYDDYDYEVIYEVIKVVRYVGPWGPHTGIPLRPLLPGIFVLLADRLTIGGVRS
jgi:hypothetical protein